MASQPSLRIGDTERDAVAAELREHYAHGRLTLDELSQRLDAVFAAKTQQDLSRITSDLPHVRPADVPLPSEQVGRPASPAGSHSAGPISLRHTRSGGDDWHRGWRRNCGGFAVFSTLLAALASWLLVYDVILVAFRLPLPGRLGLLIAVFAVLRSILRRIFGSVRRRSPVSRRRW